MRRFLLYKDNNQPGGDLLFQIKDLFEYDENLEAQEIDGVENLDKDRFFKNEDEVKDYLSDFFEVPQEEIEIENGDQG